MSLQEMSRERTHVSPRSLPRAMGQYLNSVRFDLKEYYLFSFGNSMPLHRSECPRYTENIVRLLRDGDYFLLCPEGELRFIRRERNQTIFNGPIPLLVTRTTDMHTEQEVLMSGDEEEISKSLIGLPDGIYWLHGPYCSLCIMRRDGIWFPRDMKFSIELAAKKSPGYAW